MTTEEPTAAEVAAKRAEVRRLRAQVRIAKDALESYAATAGKNVAREALETLASLEDRERGERA
jgi:hypothetical protein